MSRISQKIGDVTVIELGVASLDAENAEQMKKEVAPLLDGVGKVVLDLSSVRFVDSSGLSFFLSCLRRLNAAGGELKLCGAGRQVRAVIELVRMHKILEVHDTPEEAARAFAGQAT